MSVNSSVMEFKPIFTQRLSVRHLVPQDATRLSYYRNLPLVAKYQSPWSEERARTLIRGMTECGPTATGRWFQFGIELQKTSELVGDVGFLNCDEHGKSWIGFTLDPAHWGNGYATEAAAVVLNFYSRQNVKTVWAATEPDNYSSAKVLTRLGFSVSESTPTDLIFYKALSHTLGNEDCSTSL